MDFDGFEGVSGVRGLPAAAGRCPPLPAAARLNARAAGPKESLDHWMDQASSLGGLEA